MINFDEIVSIRENPLLEELNSRPSKQALAHVVWDGGNKGDYLLRIGKYGELICCLQEQPEVVVGSIGFWSRSVTLLD